LFPGSSEEWRRLYKVVLKISEFNTVDAWKCASCPLYLNVLALLHCCYMERLWDMGVSVA